MTTVAYLANEFPSALETYVSDEIQELRRRGIRVISGSVRRPSADEGVVDATSKSETLCLEPIHLVAALRALGLAIWHWKRISGLINRALLQGRERPMVRAKAVLHTWLGAYYAVLLRKHEVDHIHVHHGYFGSWIAMVAARLLGIGYSLTLHGSDLLLHGVYLDVKLKHCLFCVTISQFNRRHILRHFPGTNPKAIIVSRLGVDAVPAGMTTRTETNREPNFRLLAVGRLHPVKDHAFLIRACARLFDLGVECECVIAGEGAERGHLELLIRGNRLTERTTLLGHVPWPQMDSLYRSADVVVLTSHSEGIPLVLMEAMARGVIVLAPAITGIPELIEHGKSGFLYSPGKLDDLVQRLVFLYAAMHGAGPTSGNSLDQIRHAAQLKILQDFSREENLTRFAEMFLHLVAPHDWSSPHEDPLLQQI